MRSLPSPTSEVVDSNSALETSPTDLEAMETAADDLTQKWTTLLVLAGEVLALLRDSMPTRVN